jgi:hypothetical protein
VTVHTLAVIAAAAFLLSLLPGSLHYGRPKINWGTPLPYIAIAREIAVFTILVHLLFG